jgi:hypothetical protein
VLVACEGSDAKDAQDRLSDCGLVKAWGQLLRRPLAEVVDPVVGVRRAAQLANPPPKQRGWRRDVDGSNPVLVRVGGGEVGGRWRVTFDASAPQAANASKLMMRRLLPDWLVSD